MCIWVCGCIDEYTNVWKVGGWKDGRMDVRRVDGWLAGWLGGW